MSRSGMSDLIQRVRTLTGAGTAGYSVGTANYWDADQVQDVLDRHRYPIERALMDPVATYTGGSVIYTRYSAPAGYLEAGTALSVTDGVGNEIGTALWSADYQRGEFTFTTDQGSAGRYITGRTYDVHAAAAELLEAWASHEAQAFDFTTDGQSFARSQRAQGLRAQASDLRKRARVKTKRMRTGR